MAARNFLAGDRKVARSRLRDEFRAEDFFSKERDLHSDEEDSEPSSNP